MGTQPPPVLDESDLNDTDTRLIDLLYDGRATPQYAADRLDVSRTYASERLKRLVEHGHVDKLASGLYGLVDDPRDDTPRKTDESIEQLRADRDGLQNQLADCLEERDVLRERLEAADSAGVDGVRRALDDLEAALERGNGGAARSALDRARDRLDDGET